MPRIDSIRTTGTIPEQLVARVELDRTEIVRHGDVFPHFAGRQYYALSGMRLIDGSEGEWKSHGAGLEDTRIVEVVVRPVKPGAARSWTQHSSTHRRKRSKSNGVIPHEPYSDKAAE